MWATRMGRQVNHQTANSKRQIGSSVPSNMKQQVRHEAASAGDRREIGSRLAEIEARLGKMSGDESEIKRDRTSK